MSHEKYQRLLELAKTLQPVVTAVAHPCDESSLSGAVDAAKLGLIKPILVGPQGEDPGRREAVQARYLGLRAGRRAAQPRVGGGRRRARAGRQGGGADEGQPPHRRADGRGGEEGHGPAHRAPHQPLLRDGRADASRCAHHLRRCGEHRARRSRTRSTSCRTRSTSPTRCASRRCGSRSCRRSRR